MVVARITRGALRPVETPPSATAAGGESVRGAVRDPSSLRRRPSAEVHGAAAVAVVGVAVVGEEKRGKSPILASLHLAYAPLIIVPAVDSPSSSATKRRGAGDSRRRRRRERLRRPLASCHRVLRKTNPI